MEVDFLQWPQSDVNIEIKTLLTENEEIEKQPGGKNSEGFKVRSKRILVFLALKEHFEEYKQMYASDLGSSSQQPALLPLSSQQSPPPPPPLRRRKEPARRRDR